MESLTASSDEAKLTHMSSIFRDSIHRLYDSGAPFFTRENIQKAGEELQRFQNGDRSEGGNVTLKGVDGGTYEYFAKPREGPVREDEHLSKWVIYYRSIEELTSCTNLEFFDLKSAYLSLEISSVIIIILKGLESEDSHPPAPPAQDLTTIPIPFTLEKIIGLRSGALVFRSQLRIRPVLHHALISTPHSILVQHPAYTDRDRNILRSVGFTILDDPQALLDLNESCALVAISAGLPIRDIVADLCRPGLIIWGRERSSAPWNPRVKNMIGNEYTEFSFPFHQWFRNLAILVRKPIR
ncbi:hypothetical protein F5Y18DRAFT_415594 [Xylariaceae sp. FL1019]|nr:hypothetical protein F5Y18DRAFT_415594 [Xylariaceae sp. FL1019]